MVIFWKRWEPPAAKDPERPVSQDPVLRYYDLFNVEQTEGLGMPELYVPPPMADQDRPLLLWFRFRLSLWFCRRSLFLCGEAPTWLFLAWSRIALLLQ